jgi:hypothetical protein
VARRRGRLSRFDANGGVLTYSQDLGLPSLESRALLASAANEIGRLSSRIGARTLRPESSRVDILAWLQWNDPNGSYEDPEPWADECGCFFGPDDRDPIPLEDAWDLLGTVIRDAQ